MLLVPLVVRLWKYLNISIKTGLEKNLMIERPIITTCVVSVVSILEF